MTNRPELLEMPVSNSLVNRLIDGQIKVFPVAICYSNFPAEFEKKDVYAFAMKYGIIEECMPLSASGDGLADEGEEVAEEPVRYRVRYAERYNILLILQNRSKLVIEDRLIRAEPIFLSVCFKHANGGFEPFDEELSPCWLYLQEHQHLHTLPTKSPCIYR